MEPSSANENAPNMERIAPTIHAAKTMETLRPSRAISAGFRNIPVPIMVPTTIPADAHAPSPRTSSSRFSVNLPSPLRGGDKKYLSLLSLRDHIHNKPYNNMTLYPSIPHPQQT